MKKVILDFNIPSNQEELHQYLAEEFQFPAHYGKNLDALYDCLTDISEPTAIGFFGPMPDEDELDLDFLMYIERVRDVFLEAEQDSQNLAVIFGDLLDNIDADAVDNEFDDDFDVLMNELFEEDVEKGLL